MKKSTRWLGLILAFVVCVALFVPGSALALPVSPPKIGMVCLNGPNFELTATTGYIQTPDGNIVYMWSYADSSGDFQYPGPVLCVNQGDMVTITLNNDLPEATSLVFPGQDSEVMALGGSPGLMAQEVASGFSITYSFTASEPGTYIYESGSNISKQVEMGLYGALIVRPSMGSNYAYNHDSTEFDPTHEYMILLAEVDPALHHAVETGGLYDFTTLHNRYFTVNGRSFPDVLQENGTALLPTQPYGALVRIQPTNGGELPALIRMLNLGVDNHPYHPHGNHLTEIAQDGRLLLSPGGEIASSERFGETIASGQTQDYLLRWNDVDLWSPTGNPFPVSQPNYQNLTFKDGVTWYSGSPYLGYKGTLPTGTTSFNICGEWYFPWHSHALNEFTNFDEGFGGMATLLRVDPYGGCFAFPSSTKILAGTLNGGTYADLAVDDTNYYRINSTTTGDPRITDWYAQFSGVQVGSTNFVVTYKGRNCGTGAGACPALSGTNPTTLYIWNWNTSTWVQIAGPTGIGTTDVTITSASIASPAAYLGTGANKGLVRVRVLTTRAGTTNFVTGANLMKLVYDAP